MRFIDFFAGIGGISLGLERAGHECVGHCEIDPDACKVLHDHWPGIPQLGDIKEIRTDEIPEAELWCGGFPCTDISVAGNQAGIRGPETGLFFDWMRAVRVVRPKYLLMENVAALLHRGMGAVCGELAEIGYDAEWDCIPAAAVGAPHLRDRIFIVADTDTQGESQSEGDIKNFWRRPCDGDKKEAESASNAVGAGLEGHSGDVSDGRESRRDSSIEDRHATSQSIRRNETAQVTPDPDRIGQSARIFRQGPAVEFAEDCRTSLGTHVGCSWEAEPGEGWLDDELPLGMAEKSARLFGNAVVVKVAEYIGRLLKDAT